jgi:hypothetical protein
MNVLRDYNPRLYEILEIEPRLLSKAQLSKELYKWLNTNNYWKSRIIYINNELISELTGLQLNTQYNLTGKEWEFITLIYKKWLRKI